MVKLCRRASFAVLVIMMLSVQPLPAQAATDEEQSSTTPSCQVGSIDDAESDLVDAAFCNLLRRMPDQQGRSYWGAQIGGGLPVVQMLATIQHSWEYQQKSSYSLIGTLSKVRISDDRLEKAKADAAGQAAEQEANRREAALLIRQPMSVNDFNSFVDQRQFSSVQTLTPSLVHGTYASGSQSVNVLLVHLSASKGFSVSPGNRTSSSVGTWAVEVGAQAAINGNWFGPYDGPAVSSGQVYGGNDHEYTSLFGITAQKDLIMEHHSRLNETVDDRIAFGVSGHPTLIIDGTRTTDFQGDPVFTERHPRTAIGSNEQGDVLIFVTVDGRSLNAAGMTGVETVDLMAKLGSANAVMLDGGGSTTMWIAGRGVVNQPPSGVVRSVANQIAIFGD